MAPCFNAISLVGTVENRESVLPECSDLKPNVQVPDRTIGASMTPFLKLSEVRCSSFRFFSGLGELGGGELEYARRVIVRRLCMYNMLRFSRCIREAQKVTSINQAIGTIYKNLV